MLSIPHIIVIFVVALVIFGPEKLPELARNLGKLMAEFRRHTTDLRTTFEGHLRDLEREGETRRIGGTPAPSNPSASTVSGPQPVPSAPARSAPLPASDSPQSQSNAASAATATVPSAESDPFLPDLDPELAALDPYLAGALQASNPPKPSEPEKTPDPEKVTDGSARPA
jgi:sec-independent protein translocase protein TatB